MARQKGKQKDGAAPQKTAEPKPASKGSAAPTPAPAAKSEAAAGAGAGAGAGDEADGEEGKGKPGKERERLIKDILATHISFGPPIIEHALLVAGINARQTLRQLGFVFALTVSSPTAPPFS